MSKEGGNNFIARLQPLQRVLISVGFAILFYVFLKPYELSSELQVVAVWNAFAIPMLVTSWFIFFTRDPEQIRNLAQIPDNGNRLSTIFLVLLSSLLSLVAVLLLMLSEDIGNTPTYVYLPVAIGGMILSWTMVHTTFAFQYANNYYASYNEERKQMGFGLYFRDEENPDFIDFAYYSFNIGIAFQVSDVETSNRRFRRLTLVHSVLSFGLNTFVVALTINLLASLK